MTILTHVLAQGCRPTSNLSIAYELRCFWLPKVSSRARSDRSGLAVRWEPGRRPWILRLLPLRLLPLRLLPLRLLPLCLLPLRLLPLRLLLSR